MCFVTFGWDPHFWRKYPHLQVFKDWLFSRKDYYHSTWLEIPNAGWEGDSRTFFCWYVFSGLVHVNSQLERFASLSSGVHICLFSLVSIHSTAADLGLPPSSLLFSVAIMPGPSVLTQGRQKPVCQASTWKSRTLGTCSNLLFPRGVSHWAVAASAVLHVFWSSNKLPCSLLFSVASRQLEYSWSRQHSKTGGTETVLTYSSEKLEHWTYAPTFAFPKEKLGVLDVFPKLLSYWLTIKTMVMKAF